MANMTPPHKIEVIIDEDGNVSAEVKGIEGALCEQISAFLKEMGTVVSDRKTPDYFKFAKQTIHTKK